MSEKFVAPTARTRPAGSRQAVDQAFSRLAKAGKLLRVARARQGLRGHVGG